LTTLPALARLVLLLLARLLAAALRLVGLLVALLLVLIGILTLVWILVHFTVLSTSTHRSYGLTLKPSADA